MAAKDSKSAFGISSNSITNIKNDLLGLVTLLESSLLPKVQAIEKSFLNISNSIKSVNGAGGQGGANKVAVSPPPPSTPAIGNGGTPSNPSTNDTGGGGGGGGNRIASVASAASAAAYVGSAISSMLPGVPDSVMQDLLTVRSGFYGLGGSSGTLGMQTANIRNLQNSIAKNGTALNSMDSTQAIIAAQNAGLGGAKNFNQVMQGAASISNLEPGMGLTQAVQAQATANRPGTVNMLRMIGINMRTPDGRVLTTGQMIDEIWNYLSKHNSGGGTKAMTREQIQMSLMPGNGIYNMLSGLFNGDDAMIKIVGDGLILKAQTGGQAIDTISKKQMQALGVTSATVNKLAAKTAAQTDLLTTTASSTAAGFGDTQGLQAALIGFTASSGELVKALGFFNGLLSNPSGTISSALGALAAGAFKGIAGLFGFGGAKKQAMGGPTEGAMPYIVGENGPELFVPQTDGVIVPNHVLSNPHRAMGGPVKSPTDFSTQLLQSLGAPVTQSSIDALNTWQAYEGGAWKNSAHYNPLNTSLHMAGSTGMSAQNQLVQSYGSWAQGLQATVDTLTGSNAKAMGYTQLIADLKSKASSQALLSDISNSGWVSGHTGRNSYKFKGVVGYNPGGTGAEGKSGVATGGVGSSDIQSLLAQSMSLAGGSANAPAASTNNHYGGVTITINGANQSPDQIAAAVQKALNSSNLTSQVGN